uniref:Checkpoint protein n=1 Tax=Culicoides sonorensis TaxID=179676 RepID=A0A336N5S1_CULSO
MRFRAIINDANVMKEFVNILTSFAKMDKDVILNVKSNKIVVFLCCEDLQVSPVCWCDIESTSYFSQYDMVGESTEHNEIYFSVKSLNIMQTFAGFKRATDYLKLKLSQKPFICCMIETEIVGETTNHKKNMLLPIKIIPQRQWENYLLPTNTTFDMSITCTDVAKIRRAIDGAKNLAPEIRICITSDGLLAFLIEQDEYTTSWQFSQLTAEVQTKDDEGNEISETSCSVNARRFAQALAQHNFQHCSVTFSIKIDRLFKIELEVGRNVILTCILPGIFQSDI